MSESAVNNKLIDLEKNIFMQRYKVLEMYERAHLNIVPKFLILNQKTCYYLKQSNEITSEKCKQDKFIVEFADLKISICDDLEDYNFEVR